METAALFSMSFVGAILWFVSTEAAAVLYGSRGWNPMWVGAVCAAGQSLMHASLYFGGERLVRRAGRLERLVARTTERFHDHLERNFLVLVAVGSLLGIPPVVALSLLAAGFGVKITHLLPVVFLGRMLRFTVLAAGGGWLPPLPWL